MPDPTPPQPQPPVTVDTHGAPVHVIPGGKWGMGLSGWPALVSNATAVAVLILVFIWLMQNFLAQSREDRVLFRESLGVMHADSVKKWEAINANQRAVTDMATDVKRLTNAVTDGQRAGMEAATDLANAMKQLTEEVTKLKGVTQERTRQEKDKPPGGGGAFRGPGGVLPAASHPTIRALGERP